MGHGKETPRQKMIGMMYLVLTALLALNVSAEVLNAFVIVDSSLTKSVENFAEKNKSVYAAFDKAMTENAAKTKEWNDKAQIVKQKAQELIDTINKYKRRIVSIGDKVPEDVWNDSLIMNLNNVKSKDDNNVPGQVMILEKNGDALKQKVISFREDMVGLLGDTAKFANLVSSIRATLNTDDIKDTEGLMKDWSEAYFDHLPLVGVLTILSKIQTDVRNIEADMLAFLFANIDAGSYKFNKLEAIVNAPRSYVLQNNKYEAEVFIAASDTTVVPEIFVGGQKLKIKDGKGIYTGNTSTLGQKKWGGKILMKNPATEQMVEYPFSAEYEVGAPSLTVSPTKMNVLYIGVPNPLEISASGVPNNKLNPKISAGKLVKTKSGYAANVTKVGTVSISASADIQGKTVNLGSRKFRVKMVPDPVAKLPGQASSKPYVKGGAVKKAAFLRESGIRAEQENFDFDMKFQIVQYTISTVGDGGFTEDATVKGTGKFNQAAKTIMRKAKSNRKVFITNVQAKGPDKRTRKLNDLVFTIR